MTNENNGIDPDLARQIADLSICVHELLSGPHGDGQFDGEREMQQIVVDVPRGFVVLANYLARFDPAQNAPNPEWTGEEQNAQDLIRSYLSERLHNTMHADLHWLAAHDFLDEPKPLEGIAYVRIDTSQDKSGTDHPADTGKPELDDDLPF